MCVNKQEKYSEGKEETEANVGRTIHNEICEPT